MLENRCNKGWRKCERVKVSVLGEKKRKKESETFSWNSSPSSLLILPSSFIWVEEVQREGRRERKDRGRETDTLHHQWTHPGVLGSEQGIQCMPKGAEPSDCRYRIWAENMFLQNIRLFPETFLNRSFTDEFIWFIKVTFNSNVTCFLMLLLKYLL